MVPFQTAPLPSFFSSLHHQCVAWIFVWMVVSPRSSHSFRILVVRHDVVVIGELFVADCAYSVLLGGSPPRKFPHLLGIGVFDSPSDGGNLQCGKSRAVPCGPLASARDRMNGSVLILAEFHIKDPSVMMCFQMITICRLSIPVVLNGILVPFM
jgi:hypothetical protein